MSPSRRWLAPALVLALAISAAVGCRVLPGNTYTGEGTYYTGGSSGNCSYDGPEGVMYAAMNEADYENARICGGFIRVTGPLGTATVKIVDRCPECLPGDIDFSPQAFAKIANPVDGRVPISWELVSGGNIGTIAYVVKDGSSQWWLGIQPRNHRNLVDKLEINVAGTWQTLARQQYNYFLAPSGVGVGPFSVRLTDIFGQQVVSAGVTLSPSVVQPTAQQFPAR